MAKQKSSSASAASAPKASKSSSSSSSGGGMSYFNVFLVVVLAVAVGYLYNQNARLKSMVANTSTDGTLSNMATDSDGVELDLEGNRVIPKNANPEGKPREATKDCIDRHDECKQFRANGECFKNPGWMIINCPRSCNDQTNACMLRDPKLRCDRSSLNMSTDPIYHPGDMDRMFQSIQRRFGDRYEITVHSTSPWVVTFENFVSDSEADALVKSIARWERSTDTGSMNEFGESGRILSQGRTSSNGWCTHDCEKHPKVRNLMRKIEEVTGVPRANYESFQVLRYEHGQKYNVHHDYGADDVGLACGPRILTFFLYLSDVEEGGETSFNQLGIAVKPKKGRALLWPSTLNEDPEQLEPRTTHAALPVIKGTKLAANAWIHLFDYSKPNLWGCTGSFDDF